MSDHVDWPSLLNAIEATGARRVLVTHGFVPVVVRWLREHGYEADGLATRYTGESDDAPAEKSPAETNDPSHSAAPEDGDSA